VPLYPWLLALNDPEKPAGEVRGLGLVNWRDCIGEGGRASEGVKERFYDSKGDNSFMLFSGSAAEAVFGGGGFAARAAFGGDFFRYNSSTYSYSYSFTRY